jgi:hypothetical protein
MGIIAYYVHVSAEQMQLLRAAPANLWQMQGDAKFEGAELYDMDKDWQIIPWLLSEKRREEQKWEIAQLAASMRKGVSIRDRSAFEQAVEDERKRLGVTTNMELTNKMPDDVALIAIEGRGSADQRDEAIDLGLGPARVLPPKEVKELSEQLAALGPDDLGRHFDRKEMARWDVGGFDWLDDDDPALEFLITAFDKLKAFYKRAAESGHFVLIVHG